MYAVISSGARQYRVKEGDTLKIEKLAADVGSNVKFNVLLLADGDNITVGKPLIDGRTVQGSVVAHGRHKKILIVKFRRRKHHRKQMGHRQDSHRSENYKDLIRAARVSKRIQKDP